MTIQSYPETLESQNELIFYACLISIIGDGVMIGALRQIFERGIMLPVLV